MSYFNPIHTPSTWINTAVLTFLLSCSYVTSIRDLPTRCSDVKKVYGGDAQDGTYILSIGNRVALAIYCHGLQSTTGGPKEYISLEAGPSSNFASFYEKVGSSTECADKSPAETYPQFGWTEFSKLAVDIDTLVVDTGDFTFTNSSKLGHEIRYATAGDNWTSSPSCTPRGAFQINLSGTPFMPALGTHWPLSGLFANGSVINGDASVITRDYLGCYRDSGDGMLTRHMFTDPSLTSIEDCKKRCLSLSNPFAGMKDGNQCRCGAFEELKSVRPMDDSMCSPCSGDKSRFCGSRDHISIYSTAPNQVYTVRCGGYPGQCFPVGPNNPTLLQLKLDLMNGHHVCVRNNPCKNEGVCMAQYGTGFKCLCIDGYTGGLCDDQLTVVVSDNKQCPSGLQAEQCLCGNATCMYAYFQGEQCVAADGQPKVMCRPSDPSHVMLYNVNGIQTAQCPDNSKLTSCTFMETGRVTYNQNRLNNRGQAFSENRTNTCMSSATAQNQLMVQARCKMYMCDCKNGGTCNQFSGICHCPPAYYGTKCEMFDLCAYHADRNNTAAWCKNSGICTPIRTETVAATGGDNAGNTCLFPFDIGAHTFHSCVKDNRVGPPFACSGDFHMHSSHIDLGKWSPGPKYTIAAWVRPGRIDTIRRTIAGGVSDCNDFGFNLNSGTFRGFLKLSTECTRDLDAGKPIVTVGKWYMVAITNNGTHASIYQDGELRETNTVLMNHLPTTAGFRIGGELCCPKDFFHGLIKTVKVWNHDLSNEEIKRSMYNIGTSNSTTEALYNGLVGHWETGEAQLPPCDGPGVIDHGGRDWILTDGQFVSGIHCNINIFAVPKGTTVYLELYNGTTGGKLDITATTMFVDGYLDGSGAGYRGGVTSSTPGDSGQQGESYIGMGSKSLTENRGGGGGGAGASSMGDRMGRTGAGGGYGTLGANGYTKQNSFGGEGKGGRTYGDPDLGILYMGSGGGSGGNARDLTTNPKGGRGGNGGGAIKLTAATSILVRGAISVKGEDGQGDIRPTEECYSCAEACQHQGAGCSGNSKTACWDESGPGGGGSGGSIYLSAKVVNVGIHKLWARGGVGGTGWYSCGADGGFGRIRVDSVVFKGEIDDHVNAMVEMSSHELLFVDFSQTGQKQIDYTNTVYGNEVYRGCFHRNPSGNRTLAVPVSKTVSVRNRMTPSYCQQLCRQKNFMYSGTENGNECYCDNNIDMTLKSPDSDCDQACAGDPFQMCGGKYTVQVFGPPPSQPGVGHKVVPKCQPWCATADLDKPMPKWGLCDDETEDVLTSWDIQCLCPPGKTGDNCDQDCPTWTYGSGCRRTCDCNPNKTAECLSSNGLCSCLPGYQGDTCNETCADGTYGQGCTGQCNCTHNTQCNHKTGECLCKPGWTGPNCNFPCPANKFGLGCNNTCECNHGTCSPEDGTCECYPGYELPTCYQRCEGFVYGQDCMTPCNCNQQLCDAVTGACLCGPGYTGPHCEMKCPFGFWGQDCSHPCDCDIGVGCDHVYGNCQCSPGLTGERCEAECPHGTFGSECRSQCTCIMNQTMACITFNGRCLCSHGYTGVNCERTCDKGYYGQDCAHLCECVNGGSCDAVTGKCMCPEGFIGSKCELTCPTDSYGMSCNRTCTDCLGKGCNPTNGNCCGRMCFCTQHTYGQDCRHSCGCVNGECSLNKTACTCYPGWNGTHCEKPCQDGFYGPGCKQTCRCVHGSCNPTTGECSCVAGYTGNVCNNPCPPGKYGPNCLYTCPPCGPFSYPGCEAITGKCQCSTGYIGSFCDRRCPLQKFGANCAYNCTCQNGGVCDSVTGACLCAMGYTGPKCESLCPSGTWGQNCSKACQCGPYGEGCSPFEGTCFCKSGYTGVKCRQSCPAGRFGQNCTSQCRCDTNNGQCSPIDGTCLCLPGYTGDYCDMECNYGSWGKDCSQTCQCNSHGSCNPISGMCACDPGYKGYHCESQCEQDIYWGKNCNQLCSCNGAHCNHITGLCQCPAGKIGHNCEKNCDSDHFGFQCAQLCGCQNQGLCDHVTGSCRCQPGWAGKFCTDSCPDGYYGVDCSQECQECPNGGSCDTFTGACVCPSDMTGPFCNVSLLVSSDAHTNVEKLSVTTSGIHFTVSQLVGLVVGFILFVIIATILAAIATKRYYTGRFGTTEGAVKFTGEEIDIPAISTTSATSGFSNPVHEMLSTPTTPTTAPVKSSDSDATSGVASYMVESDEEDTKYFQDSNS